MKKTNFASGGNRIHMSLWMPMTDEKGVIWSAKGADYCGNSVGFLLLNGMIWY